MAKFKVGDRVKGIKENQIRIGTIEKVEHEGGTYIVRYDEPIMVGSFVCNYGRFVPSSLKLECREVIDG